MPAAWESPLTVNLSFTPLLAGEDGKREAECLVAPLRQLAKSVVLTTTEWVDVKHRVTDFKFTLLM